MFEPRDLVGYRPRNGGDVVLGKVVDIVHDVDGSALYLKVTQDHRAYVRGYEYRFDLGDPGLFKRRRYTPLKTPRDPLTHCTHGHEFTQDNTYWDPDRPHIRHCRQCRRDRNNKWYREKHGT